MSSTLLSPILLPRLWLSHPFCMSSRTSCSDARIAKSDILSSLQRWGDCITNIDDRKAFGLFALEMWPLKHLRAVYDVKSGGRKDDDKDSHHSRSSMHDQQPSTESAQLDFEVICTLEQSHEEFGFSQFLSLFGNQSERGCVGLEVVKRNIINFKCSNRDSDTAIFKLRDNPMFLAVLAFSQDTGDFFHRLSGCACAGERSKAERKLREEVFAPMKKSESENVAFLALFRQPTCAESPTKLGTESKRQCFPSMKQNEYVLSRRHQGWGNTNGRSTRKTSRR
ncbi:hypothetical protein CGRA01v4_14465 [Colletotrichum graminicola]|nr:hypothetical protein CGRA01v4_14465 [Colletotrichum graminicola]